MSLPLYSSSLYQGPSGLPGYNGEPLASGLAPCHHANGVMAAHHSSCYTQLSSPLSPWQPPERPLWCRPWNLILEGEPTGVGVGEEQGSTKDWWLSSGCSPVFVSNLGLPWPEVAELGKGISMSCSMDSLSASPFPLPSLPHSLHVCQ